MEENNNNIIISEKHIKKRHKNIKILITFITLIFLLAGGTFVWYWCLYIYTNTNQT